MAFCPDTILVIGAGHGLGLGIVKECRLRYPNAKIFATYRRREKAKDLIDFNENSFQVDPLNEDEVRAFCETLTNVDLTINCVGMLQNREGQGPEKSLRDIDVDFMTEVFQVNTFVTPLWAKYLKKKLSRETQSIFATLSAMVGSIEENEIGGWYSYRASKTALNMFLKTIAIEFSRSHLKTSVVAIHPGTTETELSKDFLKGIKHKVWTPEGAAVNILNTLEECPLEGTGLFKNWDGRTIAF